MIALLTDYGTSDPWVAEVKGRLASLAPGLAIYDLAHDLAPGDIAGGAFHLAAAVEAWPPGTIFLVVVDPGVGSSRRALAARIGGSYYVGPDNGLLSDLPRTAISAFEIRPDSLSPFQNLPPRRGTTFDGRDLFAPAAACLARGISPEALGPSVPDPILLPRVPEESVWYVDRFGNVITRIPGEKLPSKPVRSVEIKGRSFPLRGPVLSYADAKEGEVILLVSSRGTLEVALRGASFAALAGLYPGGVSRGEPIRFRL